MAILGLIPARGGSKGIPRKNILPFCGKPLIQWTIDAALASSCLDQVVVSTDDSEIAALAKDCGADVPFIRPAELASDTAPGIWTVLHALEYFSEVTDVMLLQPTSPLRNSTDIKNIVDLRKHAGQESAVSLAPCAKHPALTYSLSENHKLKPFLPGDIAGCRQQLPPAYVLNGALYLASRDFLLKEKAFIASETAVYLMPACRSVDIDTQLDWKWAEFLMENH